MEAESWQMIWYFISYDFAHAPKSFTTVVLSQVP